MRLRIGPWVTLVSALVACSSSSPSSGGGADAGGSQDVVEDVYSTCGHPGDTGNSLGVGAFCDNFHDCDGTADAHLCSIIGDSTTHFCTKICTPPPDGGDAGAADASGDDGCGDGASCQCGGAGCGCTPDACL
jgi:hypothetical protein